MNLPQLLHRGRYVVLVMLLVTWPAALVATHIPAEQLPPLHIPDKTLHAVGFFVLGSLLHWTLTGFGRAFAARSLLVLITMAGYAAFDEATQPLFNRFASVHDWLFDMLGAALAVTLWETLLALAPGQSTARLP